MAATTDVFAIKMKILHCLFLGVLLPLAAKANQSELDFPEPRPITDQLLSDGKRQIETPEVVLQLKYDRGELNRVYLTQFRKNKETRIPSVPATDNLCSDLCHSGLGGRPCGKTCADMIPVGLNSLLLDANTTGVEYGAPRVSVCPTLCQYDLGYPLCACGGTGVQPVAWREVCAAFCAADNYVLRGCPECSTETTTPESMAEYRVVSQKSTAEGWAAWCNAQCRQGQGGAACNCARSAFQ